MEQSLQKNCIKMYQEEVANGTHFIAEPDNCTLCACDEGVKKFCKEELCYKPLDCKLWKINAEDSCCNFTCLDNSITLNENDPNWEGRYYIIHRSVGIEYSILIAVIATAIIMLGFFLKLSHLYRQQQRQTLGRDNIQERE